MNKTKVEWCEYTWNPVTGCKGDCEYCYARRIAERFGGYDGCTIGGPNPFERESALKEAEIVEYGWYSMPLTEAFEFQKRGADGKLQKAPFPFGFKPTLHKDRLNEPTNDPHPHMIFVCSMVDLFGPWVPDDWIQDVFDACKAAPQHLYFFLTKYPERYGELYSKGIIQKWQDNFWFGSTVTDSKSRRFPGIIGLNTFLSIEPLHEYLDAGLGSFGGDRWIIVGAETGNRKEKIVPKRFWITNIEDAAKITRAAVFMKNSLLSIIGKESMRQEYPPPIVEWRELRRRHGGKTDEHTD